MTNLPAALKWAEKCESPLARALAIEVRRLQAERNSAVRRAEEAEAWLKAARLEIQERISNCCDNTDQKLKARAEAAESEAHSLREKLAEAEHHLGMYEANGPTTALRQERDALVAKLAEAEKHRDLFARRLDEEAGQYSALADDRDKFQALWTKAQNACADHARRADALEAALREYNAGIVSLLSTYASLLDSPVSFQEWVEANAAEMRETIKRGEKALSSPPKPAATEPCKTCGGVMMLGRGHARPSPSGESKTKKGGN
jgi:chromosome segregation ATPase